MKVAILTSENAEPLEQMVNKWLAVHADVHLIKILQTECAAENGHSLTITIFYEEAVV